MSFHDMVYGALCGDLQELPWALPEMPEYGNATFGSWGIEVKHTPLIRGYFNGMQVLEHDIPVLSKDGTVWMSLTPMELESHAPHLSAMKGHVVIAGLGLGMIAYNALRKPDVTKVTVLESCKDNVEFIKALASKSSWAGLEKLNLLHTDALQHKEDACDYLYADIWPLLGAEEAYGDVYGMVRNMGPAYASWWGMELDFVGWCRARDVPTPISCGYYEEWRTELAADGVRVPDFGEEYAHMAEEAARNVMQY